MIEKFNRTGFCKGKTYKGKPCEIFSTAHALTNDAYSLWGRSLKSKKTVYSRYRMAESSYQKCFTSHQTIGFDIGSAPGHSYSRSIVYSRTIFETVKLPSFYREPREPTCTGELMQAIRGSRASFGVAHVKSFPWLNFYSLWVILGNAHGPIQSAMMDLD